MELNEYQERAMSTCMGSCNNMAYSLTGLTAEVGEINDKIAKWVRKGLVSMRDNHLIIDGSVASEQKDAMYEELFKEIGDVLWFVAHIATQTGIYLEDVAQMNLDKLASRKERGVIDGNGDNR